MRTSPWPLVVTGGVVGLSWAAALRGWMAQMAASESQFHWYGTFLLVLAPGLFAGAVIGLAEHRRRTLGSRQWWSTFAPCLFLSALANPTTVRALFTNGFGGGAVGVVLFGLSGGYGLSGRGRASWRRACGGVAVLGVLLMLVVASDTVRLGTARGTWVGVLASSLVVILCLSSAIPQRIGRPSLVPARWIAAAVGGLGGLAWTASLRLMMWEVAGDDAAVTWTGTFLWLFVPGTIIGAMLGAAEYRRRTGDVPHRRWLMWSPMLFASVLLRDPLVLIHGFNGGIGLAALAVPAMCMLGGHAIGGRGPWWVRGLSGSVVLSAIPIWTFTATDVGGASMSLGTPRGAWVAVLLWSLLATSSMAAAIPHRAPVRATTRTLRSQPPCTVQALLTTPPA